MDHSVARAYVLIREPVSCLADAANLKQAWSYDARRKFAKTHSICVLHFCRNARGCRRSAALHRAAGRQNHFRVCARFRRRKSHGENPFIELARNGHNLGRSGNRRIYAADQHAGRVLLRICYYNYQKFHVGTKEKVGQPMQR